MKKTISVLLLLSLLVSMTTVVFADDYYVVQTGDVLWKVAEEQGTTWQELAQVNNLENPNLIYPGQKLMVKEEMTVSNKDKAVALLNSIENGDPTPAGYINPNKYIQHNLGIADGIEGFGAALSMLPEGSASVDVVRAFEDGDYVFTHTDYNFFGPKIGFDVFRFEDGLIVEHWDNLTVTSETTNPSGHTQIDGITEVKDFDKTEENKALVKEFVENILVEGKYEVLGNYFDGDNYIQHNTQIADGLSGLGEGIQAMAEQGITMEYDTIHKVLGEGNFVLVVSEGKFAGEATSYYDLFRVENGKIAEHWDVIESILPEDQWMNDNGKF